MAGSHGTKAVIAALLANMGIAIMKFVAYIFTGSGRHARREHPLGGRLR